MILNLVKNGFEAMPQGGTLAITVDRTAAGGWESCVIDFEDSGGGIAEDMLKEIFLPFFSTKHGTGVNTGLGLSICYSIVTKYGGSIHASNRESGGCRFTVTLPVAR